MLSPGTQPPASNAVANGPITGVSMSSQGHPSMGLQPAISANSPAPSMGSSQKMSASLSPGAAVNGPLSQMKGPPVGNSVQSGFPQPGSAFTPVTSSHPDQPSQNLPPTPPVPGASVQGMSNVHPHAPQTTSYTGQPQGVTPQTSGVSPTAPAQVNQPLSALHSNKPKRPVMPMNAGPGYPGQRGSPSPRSTPPPPVGPPGSAMSQRSTPPPPTNLLGSTASQGPYNSPAIGYPPMGQDSQAGARPISSRRRLYPAQVFVVFFRIL